MSGLILNEDAIAKAIRAEDDSDRARYQQLQQAQIERLRSELAAERTMRLQAESLTWKQAGLIGEQKEQLRVAATIDGIVKAIHNIADEVIYADQVAAILAALGAQCKENEVNDREFSAVTAAVDKAHDAAHDYATHDTMAGVVVGNTVRAAMDTLFPGAAKFVQNMGIGRPE